MKVAHTFYNVATIVDNQCSKKCLLLVNNLITTINKAFYIKDSEFIKFAKCKQ